MAALLKSLCFVFNMSFLPKYRVIKMGQAQINVRTRACSGTFIARTKQAALTHNQCKGKRLKKIMTF